MALARYEHTGAAPATGLQTMISNSATSCVLLSGTGYPTGAIGPFVLCFDPGTSSEEKVLCSARSGTAVTFAGGGRGYDGTSPAQHSAGTTNVQHVWSGAEADDTSDHIYNTARDDHTEYAKTDGSRAVTGPATFNSTVEIGGALDLDSSLDVSGAAVFNSTLTGPSLAASLAGAGRYVGGTNGAPSSGTFLTGDYATDITNNVVWLCTAGGTPGTWAAASHQEHAFQVHLASNLSINSATVTTVHFDTVDRDTDTGWSASTFLYTIPTTGWWSFNAIMAWATNGTGVRLLSFAGTIPIAAATASTDPSIDAFGRGVISGQYYATSGQTIGVAVYQTSGGALNTGHGGGAVQLSGIKLL